MTSRDSAAGTEVEESREEMGWPQWGAWSEFLLNVLIGFLDMLCLCADLFTDITLMSPVCLSSSDSFVSFNSLALASFTLAVVRSVLL